MDCSRISPTNKSSSSASNNEDAECFNEGWATDFLYINFMASALCTQIFPYPHPVLLLLYAKRVRERHCHFFFIHPPPSTTDPRFITRGVADVDFSYSYPSDKDKDDDLTWNGLGHMMQSRKQFFMDLDI